MSTSDASSDSVRRQRRFRWPIVLILFAALVLLGVTVGAWEMDQAAKALQEQKLADARKAVEGFGTITPRHDEKGFRVYLKGDKLTDEKLQSLVEDLELLAPAEVDIVNAPVSDKGVECLTRLPDIQAIYLHQTKVSPEGIKKLQAKLPKAKIHTTAPDPVASPLVGYNVYRHAVDRIAYSPSGDTIVAGDGHGMLHVWDVKSGALRHLAQAHESWLFALAFAPDGRLLATGGGDALVRLWDTKHWNMVGELRGHTDDVHAVAFTPDGRRLVTAGDDWTVRVWNISEGGVKASTVQSLEGHKGSITTIAISPDGKLIASGSRDETIHLWDATSGKFIRSLTGHTDDVMGVMFRPDGRQIASASYDKTVRLWDVELGQPTQILRGHDNRVYSVAYRPDGQQLASSAGDSLAIIWDVASGRSVRQLNGDKDLSSIVWHPQEAEIAVASAEGSVAIWNAERGELLNTLRSKYSPASASRGPLAVRDSSDLSP